MTLVAPLSMMVDTLEFYSETVKTRMQVSGAGVGTTIAETFAEGGIRPFYKGLLFAFGRELSYTS